MGFPTENDHFGVFGGYHHLRKQPYIYIYYMLFICTTLLGEILMLLDSSDSSRFPDLNHLTKLYFTEIAP